MFLVSTGVLACLDGYMNIAIEQTEEYVNGQLKNKYGDAFLRGNNGNSVSGYFKSFIYFSFANWEYSAAHTSLMVKHHTDEIHLITISRPSCRSWAGKSWYVLQEKKPGLTLLKRNWKPIKLLIFILNECLCSNTQIMIVVLMTAYIIQWLKS